MATTTRGLAAAVTPEAGTPTETAPDLGIVQIEVGDCLVPISEVEHWVEDGQHVFRSREFDCLAEHEDEFAAARIFLANAEDLFRYLDDLYDAGRATDDEIRILVKLSRRFYEVYDALQQTEQRRGPLSVRRRRVPTANWQRLTTPASSSPPVHA